MNNKDHLVGQLTTVLEDGHDGFDRTVFQM